MFGTNISKNRISTISLVVSSSNSTRETRVFNKEEITIGRASHSDLFLDEEIVSNHHARFIFHHMQWWIEDLESKNGTTINGQKLSTPTVVTSGDELLIGNFKIQISIINISNNSISDNLIQGGNNFNG